MGDGDAAATLDQAEIGRIFREESGRSVATLIGVFGDIDLAEDAVQDAFAAAMKTWPRDGLPPNPGAWITRTARNRAVDRLRRDARGRELVRRAAVLDTVTDGPDGPGAEDPHPGPVDDDRLRLIFTCCHPALSSEARIALTLRLVGGLSTAEVASAFLVPESTMAKRLVRAKHKIAAARIPFRLPAGADLAERLGAVLAVLYLVYNSGSGRPDRSDLRAEGIRLTRLVRALLPDEPEVGGLLAQMALYGVLDRRADDPMVTP